MLASEAINEAARFMNRSRPAITERMLLFGCQRCGKSFSGDEIPIVQGADRFVYRCPNDDAELVRVGVGQMGRGGGDIEVDQAEWVRVRVGTEEVDWQEFFNRGDRQA